MQQMALGLRQTGKRIALVPTMGALHSGHMALVDRARACADIVVVSIFVNPTQFGPTEDLAKYPRPIEHDMALAGEHGCDIIFAPGTAEMYPEGFNSWVTVEAVTGRLCGASRPGHFRGVTTVVFKLLALVQPHLAVFGRKDAQQCVVIRRMVSDLNIPVELDIVPTVRDPDGLAMSSRNVYLTAAERQAALSLSRGLHAASSAYTAGERCGSSLVECVRTELKSQQLIREEYVECVDTGSLDPVKTVHKAVLVALACRTIESGTRLIDNVVLGGNL